MKRESYNACVGQHRALNYSYQFRTQLVLVVTSFTLNTVIFSLEPESNFISIGSRTTSLIPVEHRRASCPALWPKILQARGYLQQYKSLDRFFPILRYWDNWLFLFKFIYTSYRTYEITLIWTAKWETSMLAEHHPETQENYLPLAGKTGPLDWNNVGTWKL